MEQSTEKVDTTGRSRRAIDSLTPLVASTVEVGGFEAITVTDPTLEDLTDPCHMDLTTRESFLDAAYTPMDQFDATGPYYRFRVQYEPETRQVNLYRLKIVPIEIDPSVPPRLLAHNVRGCRFQVLTVGTVGVTLEIEADQENEARPDGITTTTLTAILISPGNK
jgi:hypothetical protein